MTEDKQTPKQLVQTVQNTGLANYGERDLVYELAARLMSLHPDAQKLGKAVMVAAAQLALRQGINPLIGAGEMHIFESKGKPRIYVALPFYQRKAREVAGSILWDIQPRPMSKEERMEWDVPDNEIGSICRGARKDDVLELGKAGYKPDDVWRMVSRVGVGTVNPQEKQAKKAGRPLAWTANKRAEVDCMRHLIPTLEQPGKLYTQEVDAWTQIAVAPPPEGQAATIHHLGNGADPIIDEDTGEVLFGPDPQQNGMTATPAPEFDDEGPGPRSPEQVRKDLHSAADWGPGLTITPDISKTQKSGLGGLWSKALKSMGITDSKIGDAVRYGVLDWFWEVRSFDFLSNQQASAMISWLKDGDTWEPNAVAVQELYSIVLLLDEQAGQDSLPGTEE